MLSAGTEVEQPGGRPILQQGTNGRHAYLLLNGKVKVTARSSDGHETLLGIRVGGDLVGEMGALEGCERSATVVTCRPMLVRVIQSGELMELMRRYPEIASGITKMVSGRLRSANRRRMGYLGSSRRTRVCQVLAELVSDHGVCRDGRWSLGVPLTQAELASLVGIKLRTVEKELRALQDEGVVECLYRQISIIDLTALQHLANGS